MLPGQRRNHTLRNYAPVAPNQSGSEALAEIPRHNPKAHGSWEGKARTWDDIEGVRQERVSFRRLRPENPRDRQDA